MDDLISRQAAIDAVGGNEPVGDPSKMDDDDVVKMWERIRIINIINKLPSAQPEQKGKWIWSEENASWCCGACDCVFEEIDWRPEYNFCPNCGADMRGEEE